MISRSSDTGHHERESTRILLLRGMCSDYAFVDQQRFRIEIINGYIYRYVCTYHIRTRQCVNTNSQFITFDNVGLFPCDE